MKNFRIGATTCDPGIKTGRKTLEHAWIFPGHYVLDKLVVFLAELKFERFRQAKTFGWKHTSCVTITTCARAACTEAGTEGSCVKSRNDKKKK